jgi:hypothetical protein
VVAVGVVVVVVLVETCKDTYTTDPETDSKSADISHCKVKTWQQLLK